MLARDCSNNSTVLFCEVYDSMIASCTLNGRKDQISRLHRSEHMHVHKGVVHGHMINVHDNACAYTTLSQWVVIDLTPISQARRYCECCETDF